MCASTRGVADSTHSHDAVTDRGVSTGWNREHSWPKSCAPRASQPTSCAVKKRPTLAPCSLPLSRWLRLGAALSRLSAGRGTHCGRFMLIHVLSRRRRRLLGTRLFGLARALRGGLERQRTQRRTQRTTAALGTTAASTTAISTTASTAIASFDGRLM
jgi:hypothetical protein